MSKPTKKVITDDVSIDRAESKLNIKYPQIIREKLKESNGFYWGSYKFFCVLDDEDKYHTFDDVVRENENESTGWKQYLPEGHVAIANEDLYCLTLNEDKDGKIYEYNHENGNLEVFAENDGELEKKLDEQDEEFENM